MRESIREYRLRPNDYQTATKLIGWSWVGLRDKPVWAGKRIWRAPKGDEPNHLGVQHAQVSERLYAIDAVMAADTTLAAGRPK